MITRWKWRPLDWFLFLKCRVFGMFVVVGRVPEMSAIESKTEETELICVEELGACECAVIGEFCKEGLCYGFWVCWCR
jgi:hypothetical protein